MSKTHRRTEIDSSYGCFESYYASKGDRWFYNRPQMSEEALAQDMAEERKYWDARNRDGKSGYYHCEGDSARGFYRKLSRKYIRAKTRQEIHRCIRANDWEDAIFPDHGDTKKFIWSVW